jgi:hypothetical protein
MNGRHRAVPEYLDVPFSDFANFRDNLTTSRRSSGNISMAVMKRMKCLALATAVHIALCATSMGAGVKPATEPSVADYSVAQDVYDGIRPGSTVFVASFVSNMDPPERDWQGQPVPASPRTTTVGSTVTKGLHIDGRFSLKKTLGGTPPPMGEVNQDVEYDSDHGVFSPDNSWGWVCPNKGGWPTQAYGYSRSAPKSVIDCQWLAPLPDDAAAAEDEYIQLALSDDIQKWSEADCKEGLASPNPFIKLAAIIELEKLGKLTIEEALSTCRFVDERHRSDYLRDATNRIYPYDSGRGKEAQAVEAYLRTAEPIDQEAVLDGFLHPGGLLGDLATADFVNALKEMAAQHAGQAQWARTCDLYDQLRLRLQPLLNGTNAGTVPGKGAE